MIKTVNNQNLGFESNLNLYEVYLAKGRALYNLKKYEEAIECYNKSIENNPNVYDVYCAKGDALNNLDNYQEAIECYNKAIQINPNDSSEANNNKGVALYNLKIYDEAINCFNKSIQINPSISDVYLAKGKTLIELERFQEAIECYNKVLEIDSNDSEAINKRNFLLQKIQEESNIFKKNENLNIDLITNDVDITLDLRDKSNESNHNLCVTDCAKKNALNILEKNKQAIETFKKISNYF